MADNLVIADPADVYELALLLLFPLPIPSVSGLLVVEASGLQYVSEPREWGRGGSLYPGWMVAQMS